MTTATEVLSKAWRFSVPITAKGGMRMSSLLSEDAQPVSFLLGPKGDYPATVPFAPSSFEGKDSSGKLTLVFNVTDAVYQAILEMEKKAREALEIDEARWNSAVKPASAYPATLRVKYRDPLIVGEDRKTTSLPEPWRRLEANALILVKGVYMAARTGCGLMLEVVQMQIRPDESQTLPPKSVF